MDGRCGGDEFVALLPDGDEVAAKEMSERVHAAGREASGGSDWRDLPSVTISVGLAQMNPDHTPHGLIEAADAQLYVAKANRKKGPSKRPRKEER